MSEGKRLGDLALVWCVTLFALASIGISLVFNPAVSGAPRSPMPGYLGFLFIGLLGVLVANVLFTQHRRIRLLERALERSNDGG